MKNKQDQSDHATWEEYERRKAAWLNKNPSATPEQYQNAVMEIAKRCGL